MNGHNRHPFRIEHQVVMLAEQRVRELHQLAAERRLAALAAPPAPTWRFRLLARLRLPLRAAMQATAQCIPARPALREAAVPDSRRLGIGGPLPAQEPPGLTRIG